MACLILQRNESLSPVEAATLRQSDFRQAFGIFVVGSIIIVD